MLVTEVRRARERGWRPYQMVRIGIAEYEVISMPFVSAVGDCDRDRASVMIREKDDPMTMREIGIVPEADRPECKECDEPFSTEDSDAIHFASFCSRACERERETYEDIREGK